MKTTMLWTVKERRETLSEFDRSQRPKRLKMKPEGSWNRLYFPRITKCFKTISLASFHYMYVLYTRKHTKPITTFTPLHFCIFYKFLIRVHVFNDILSTYYVSIFVQYLFAIFTAILNKIFTS